MTGETFYGVAVGRFDPKPGGITAPIVAEMLLGMAINGECERMQRLLDINANKAPDAPITSDKWNEKLKRDNWKLYVRALRLLGGKPETFDKFEHVDLFAK